MTEDQAPSAAVSVSDSAASANEPRRRLTARGSQRRGQLIALATRRFAADGYHPTSVADIVDELGVGKGVFYWYFESKEMLLEEILRDAQRGLRRAQNHAASTAPGPIEMLEMGIRGAVKWSAEQPELAKLVEFALTDERFEPLVRKGRASLVSDTVPLLRNAIDQGIIPEADPEMLAYAVFGVAAHLTSVFLERDGSDPDVLADAVVDFCLRGIGAR
ncbi:MAG: TetR/AcrR family transcriptional regulator [Actinobacteria bacterium]|nr:TetR/AcrR family transcriptional regulator [Actinomycetota bacterium]